jgi:hypothetical protein
MTQVERGVNRRGSRRRPPKSSTKIRCFRGAMGLGSDVALSALDISETGASLLLKAAFKAGEQMELQLESTIQRRPIRLRATVIWCVAAQDDRWMVGVKFQGTVRYADLNDLARS